MLGGTNGHGHDNKFNTQVDIIDQHTNPLLSFRRTHQHNHIQQSTTAEEQEEERQRVLLIAVLFSLFDHTFTL